MVGLQIVYVGIVFLVFLAVSINPLIGLLTTTVTSPNIGVGNLSAHPNTTGGITSVVINGFVIAIILFLIIGIIAQTQSFL